MAKGNEIVSEMSQCNSFFSLLRCYMKAVLYCISFVSCLLFWPVAVLFIKYYNDGKYYLSKGIEFIDCCSSVLEGIELKNRRQMPTVAGWLWGELVEWSLPNTVN